VARNLSSRGAESRQRRGDVAIFAPLVVVCDSSPDHLDLVDYQVKRKSV
jgi:hypothetical protein